MDDFNREPRLAEILEDPLVQAVMRSYGVERETIEAFASGMSEAPSTEETG